MEPERVWTSRRTRRGGRSAPPRAAPARRSDRRDRPEEDRSSAARPRHGQVDRGVGPPVDDVLAPRDGLGVLLEGGRDLADLEVAAEILVETGDDRDRERGEGEAHFHALAVLRVDGTAFPVGRVVEGGDVAVERGDELLDDLSLIHISEPT